MFCRHNWKILDKTIFPSAMEQLSTDGAGEAKMPHWVFVKKVVVIVVCEKCGKIKKYCERS